MGTGMAANLQRFLTKDSRPNLIYYNRTAAKGDGVKALGGVPATSIEQLVAKCDVIFSCVGIAMKWYGPIFNDIAFERCRRKYGL